MADSRTDPGWPFNTNNYMPDLENGLELLRRLEHFEKTLLSDETMVGMIEASVDGSDMRESVLDTKHFDTYIQETLERTKPHRFFFFNRFLVSDKNAPLPKDSNKLRISGKSFHSLISQLQIPVSFVSALSQLYLPSGRGFSASHLDPEVICMDFWYILPIRIQYECNDKQQSHAASTAGSNQMDPLHYLHLPDSQVDIRGSKIAILSRYSGDGRLTTTLIFNFMDGRWSKSVEEPKRRLWETAAYASRLGLAGDPFYIHSIYYTSGLRWWTNALSSVNEQLIAYEKRLQEEIDGEVKASNTYNVVNRALHAMAAHLHRYGSELSSMQDTLNDIFKRHQAYANSMSSQDTEQCGRVSECFSQIASQLRQVRAFLQELEVKLKNILALLFNRIQITNDRMMVSNGEKMHSILLATQEENRISRDIALRSRELTEEMKQDSVAMKTIAVTTMFFLPGTSFAAFLAMPFFMTNQYLTDVSKFWIWVVCTVPATLIAFAFYYYWRRRDDRRKRIALDTTDIEWNNPGP